MTFDNEVSTTMKITRQTIMTATDGKENADEDALRSQSFFDLKSDGSNFRLSASISDAAYRKGEAAFIGESAYRRSSFHRRIVADKFRPE